MVTNLEDVRSLRVDICRLCGGWLDVSADEHRPNVMEEHWLRRWVIYLPTHRDFHGYTAGSCECHHIDAPVDEGYSEGDGG